MLPPTKQEIANPYIDKVTDSVGPRYGNLHCFRKNFYLVVEGFTDLNRNASGKRIALAGKRGLFTDLEACTDWQSPGVNA